MIRSTIRAAVIAATLALLGQRGIAGSTIEADAQRSGVAKTTIYRQGADQPALVLDAIASTLRAPPDPDTGTLREDLGPATRRARHSTANQPGGCADAGPDRRRPTRPGVRGPAPARGNPPPPRRPGCNTHGIHRGGLPAGTDPGEVLDLLAGPIFYRRWVSFGTVDQTFTTLTVDPVLAAYTSQSPASGSTPAGPPAARTRSPKTKVSQPLLSGRLAHIPNRTTTTAAGSSRTCPNLRHWLTTSFIYPC